MSRGMAINNQITLNIKEAKQLRNELDQLIENCIKFPDTRKDRSKS